jgi:hypothetical protein
MSSGGKTEDISFLIVRKPCTVVVILSCISRKRTGDKKNIRINQSGALTIVDVFLERQTLNKNRGGAFCTGADGPRAGPDGPRPGARGGGALCARADCPRPGAGRSTAWGRTVHGLVRG